jgi:hypothetical protein
VRVSESDEQFSAIGLRDSMKPQLKTWARRTPATRSSGQLGSIDGVAYATATAGQKNTWLTNNADRVLFGAPRPTPWPATTPPRCSTSTRPTTS